MKYKEISELLNISIKTVENHIGNALKRLHEYKSLINTLLTYFVLSMKIFFTF